MIDEQKYHKLKKQISLLERERDEASGALKQIMETLKQEFKCNSIKQARIKLVALEAEAAEKEEIFNREFKKFQREYGPFLEALEKGDPDSYRKVPESLIHKSKGKKRGKKT